MARRVLKHTTKVRRRHRSVEGTSYDAFTVPSVSGLVAWYDFSDPSTLYKEPVAGTPAVWTPNVAGGVVAVSGSNFLKTSGNYAWDGQVYSTEGYTTNVYVSAESNTGLINENAIGLNESPGASAHYNTIDYCFVNSGAGDWVAYENGVSVATPGAAQAGDVVSLTYDGVNIRYYVNGILAHMTARAVGNPLYLDSSLATVAADSGWKNVAYGPVSYPNVSADGDAIYQVNDKSGSGNHLVQATAGFRPLYKTGIRNGRSVSRWDGDDWLLKTSLTATTTTTSFMVFADSSVATTQYLLDYAAAADLGFVIIASELYWYTEATAPIFGSVSNNTCYIASVTRPAEAGTSATYLNGSPGQTGAVGAGTISNYSLGANGPAAGGSGTIGDICETLLYNSVLSAADHNAIGRALAYKWGTTWTAVT